MTQCNKFKHGTRRRLPIYQADQSAQWHRSLRFSRSLRHTSRNSKLKPAEHQQRTLALMSNVSCAVCIITQPAPLIATENTVLWTQSMTNTKRAKQQKCSSQRASTYTLQGRSQVDQIWNC